MFVHRPDSMAARVVAAGLGAALAASPVAAMAETSKEAEGRPGESYGQTQLTVRADGTDLTTPEGENETLDQVRVTIPVRIDFVAKSDGELKGPEDGKVKFSNNSTMPVHVASAKVTSSEGTRIATAEEERAAEAKGEADVIHLGLTNSKGDAIDLGRYAGDGAALKEGAWDIARSPKQDGKAREGDSVNKLYLNKLGGRISGFGKLDPARQTQVGQIHWTVRPGIAKAANGGGGA